MEKFHLVENVRCEAGKLSLIVDGKALEFPFEKISISFANATAEQLKNFEVSPSGYGIHWPLLDEDVSIDGLLGSANKDLGEKLLQSVREMKARKAARRSQ